MKAVLQFFDLLFRKCHVSENETGGEENLQTSPPDNLNASDSCLAPSLVQCKPR